jgi:hypothetical protein
MKPELANAFSLSDPVERFRALSLAFRDFMAEEGLAVIPFESPELPLFRKLDQASQQQALQVLGMSLEVFAEVKAEGNSLRDTPKLLWRCLSRLGWTPTEDIFDKIEDGDVVEIYSLQQVGLFRNLCFYEYVSFTLEQLFASTWYELTERDPEPTRKLYEMAMGFIRGEITQTIDPQVQPHVIRELRSARLLDIEITMRFCAPLKHKRDLSGIMVVNRSRIVGQRAPKS